MDKAESKGIRVALTVTAVLSLLVIFEGIETPKTFSLPIASANKTAQTEESNPPDNPRTLIFGGRAYEHYVAVSGQAVGNDRGD